MSLIYIAGFVICFAVASVIYGALAGFVMKRRASISATKHDEGSSAVIKASPAILIKVK